MFYSKHPNITNCLVTAIICRLRLRGSKLILFPKPWSLPHFDCYYKGRLIGSKPASYIGEPYSFDWHILYIGHLTTRRVKPSWVNARCITLF